MEMSSGVVTSPFPSFQRRGGRAAAGVVSKRSRSAPFCWKLLTTPSAPLRNGIFLLMEQLPLLENGGEWARLATHPFPLRSWLINSQFSSGLSGSFVLEESQACSWSEVGKDSRNVSR